MGQHSFQRLSRKRYCITNMELVIPYHYSNSLNSYWCVCVLSHDRLFATPWTTASQASLPMGFSRQEYWRGLPFPTPGDLPNPGIKLETLASPALAGGFFTTVLLGRASLLAQTVKNLPTMQETQV